MANPNYHISSEDIKFLSKIFPNNWVTDSFIDEEGNTVNRNLLDSPDFKSYYFDRIKHVEQFINMLELFDNQFKLSAFHNKYNRHLELLTNCLANPRKESLTLLVLTELINQRDRLTSDFEIQRYVRKSHVEDGGELENLIKLFDDKSRNLKTIIFKDDSKSNPQIKLTSPMMLDRIGYLIESEVRSSALLAKNGPTNVPKSNSIAGLFTAKIALGLMRFASYIKELDSKNAHIEFTVTLFLIAGIIAPPENENSFPVHSKDLKLLEGWYDNERSKIKGHLKRLKSPSSSV